MPPKFESIKNRPSASKDSSTPPPTPTQPRPPNPGPGPGNGGSGGGGGSSGTGYKLEVIAVFTPHVRLVRRTAIDKATNEPKPGHPPQTFVRKTVSDPGRAKRELEHLYAQCRHPNVLKYVSGTKHTNGTVDIDMEFADAGQLDSVLGRIPPGNDRVRAAKCCARQVLSGLVYYHEVHGRCHRDVKPANFLVRCDGIIKVSDFDVSKELSMGGSGGSNALPNNGNSNGGGGESGNSDQNNNNNQQVQHARKSTENTVIGTTGYMPPELVLGSLNVSPARSDVWSFGVTLMQLLEGELPFKKFYLGNFSIPNNDHISKLAWALVKDDECVEFLLRRSLVVNPDDRLTLAEATALTFVIVPDSRNDDADPWSNGYADSNDANVKIAKEMGVELCDEVMVASRCAPPKKVEKIDDPSVKKSCLVYDPEEYEAVHKKIQTAAIAMQKELQSWKAIRAVQANREKIDKAMKEVCRLRCEKTWHQLVAAAPWMKNQ